MENNLKGEVMAVYGESVFVMDIPDDPDNINTTIITLNINGDDCKEAMKNAANGEIFHYAGGKYLIKSFKEIESIPCMDPVEIEFELCRIDY